MKICNYSNKHIKRKESYDMSLNSFNEFCNFDVNNIIYHIMDEKIL